MHDANAYVMEKYGKDVDAQKVCYVNYLSFLEDQKAKGSSVVGSLKLSFACK
jgi:hypothetical protein